MSGLKSRNPPIRTARHLDDFDPQDHWRTHWRQHATKNCDLTEDPAAKVPDFALKRREWCNLNRIRTEHGICNKALNQWGIIEVPACDRCPAQIQSPECSELA
nr:unnamed protein product [Callosobruchus analis]